jgi:hypothetical protein
MSYPWTDLRLTQAWAAAQSGCDCAGCVDVISLVAAVRRLAAILDRIHGIARDGMEGGDDYEAMREIERLSGEKT